MTTIDTRCASEMTVDNGMRIRCVEKTGHVGVHYAPGHTWGQRSSTVTHSIPRTSASTVSMSITTPQDARKAPQVRLDMDLVGVGYIVVEFSPEEFTRLLAGGVLSDVEVEVQR